MSTGFGRPIVHLGLNAKVAVGGTSAGVALPRSGVNMVYLLTCDTDCWVKWGAGAQTASATSNTGHDLFMPAGMAVVVRVDSGTTHIAALRDTGDGFLVVHEITAE